MTMSATLRPACSRRSIPPMAPSSPASTAGTGRSSSRSSWSRSTPTSPTNSRSTWSATTTAPTRAPASSHGSKHIPGSTSTSPRPTRPGSTRSSASSPTSPPTCCNAQTTAASKHSNKTSATGSKDGTRTRSPSSGPNPQNKSWNPSNDFYNELPTQDTSTEERKSRLRGFLGILGPGLVTGVADDDPSGVATYSQAGAAFGVGLLWTAPLSLPLMYAVQEICDRTALATGDSLGTLVRRRFERAHSG